MATFQLDGNDYEYTPLKAKASLKLMTRITRAVGKPLGSLMNASEPGQQVSALMELFSAVDDDTLEHCIQTFGAQCTYTDKTGANFRLDKAFDAHFAGRQMSAIAWLAQCAGAEYGDFLAELNRLGAKGQSPAA